MNRSFTPLDLVQLPRCSATEAHVLATSLLTVADAETALPAHVVRSRDRLRPAAAELAAALQPQVAQASTTRQADAAVDAAWSACFDWLAGWTKLPPPHNAHKELADHLFELCFFEGLRFTLREYKIEWQDSGSRLEAINRGGHRETFAILGGAGFLANIEECHARYGEALGITAPKPSPAETAALAKRRSALLHALREYVTKVAAYADKDEPGSQELCDRLLRPLAEWAPARPAAAPTTEPAPAT
jgi:hypothetical protein